MAFAISCPKCKAQLKLDEAPAADEAIECPGCGNQFSPEPPPPERKELPADMKKGGKGGGKSKKKDGGTKKKKKVKKKKSNPFILVLMSIGALVILACVGTIGFLLFSRSNTLSDMLSYIPADCNRLRGVNVGLIYRYPGFRQEMDKQLKIDISDYSDELAKALGKEPEGFLDYAIEAKKKDRGSGAMVVLHTKAAFDTNALTSLGNKQDVSGVTCYRVSGKGSLSGCAVLVPNNRILVVVRSGGLQEQLLKSSAAGGVANKANSIADKLGDTGDRIMKGNIWTMIRAEGDYKTYISSMMGDAKDDFKPLGDQMAKAKIWGLWTSFGAGGIRFGAAVDCDSQDTAASVSRGIADGPMGKGDDSEPPNGFKKAFSQSSNKEFRQDFMSNIKYTYSGNCVYFETKMSVTKASQMLSIFNNPNIAP